ANMIAPINHAVRGFIRDPGTAAIPAAKHNTYQPRGKKLPAKVTPFNDDAPPPNAINHPLNGGEYIEEESVENDYVVPTMTNPFEAADVNLDGRITAFDALIVINELNRGGVRPIDTSPGG